MAGRASALEKVKARASSYDCAIRLNTVRRLLTVPLLLLLACGTPALVVVMNSENNSGQSGTATLTETREGLTIEIVIQKANDPRPYPTHLHEGRCGEIGPALSTLPNTDRSIVLDFIRDPSEYNVATDGGTLMSRTTLPQARLSDISDGGWLINVHDPRDNSLYVSCGNIN